MSSSLKRTSEQVETGDGVSVAPPENTPAVSPPVVDPTALPVVPSTAARSLRPWHGSTPQHDFDHTLVVPTILHAGGRVLIKFEEGLVHHRVEREVAIAAFPVLSDQIDDQPYSQHELLAHMVAKSYAILAEETSTIDSVKQGHLVQHLGQMIGTAYNYAYNQPAALGSESVHTNNVAHHFFATWDAALDVKSKDFKAMSIHCVRANMKELCSTLGSDTEDKLANIDRREAFQHSLPSAMNRTETEFKAGPEESPPSSVPRGKKVVPQKPTKILPSVWKKLFDRARKLFGEMAHIVRSNQTVKFCFVLEFEPHGDQEIAALKRLDEKEFSTWKPAPPTAGSVSETAIADSTSLAGSSKPFDVQKRREIIEAYRSTLMCASNKAPALSTRNISKGIDQIIQLVAVGHQIGGHETIRAQVSMYLMNVNSQTLYGLVAKDPVKFMMVAEPLRYRPVYEEALVHLAGSYPAWSAFPTLSSAISPAIMDIVRRKSKELVTLRQAVDREIILNLWIEGQGNHACNPANAREFEGWFMCNLFRDWFCEELRKQSGQHPVDGTLYRNIARGGDAFLPWQPMQELLSRYENDYTGPFGGFLNSHEIFDDLKSQMMESVKELVINKTHVPEEEAKFKYFTCTKVEKDDYTWEVDAPSEEMNESGST